MLDFLNDYIAKLKKPAGLLIGVGILIIMGIPFSALATQIMMGMTFLASLFYFFWCMSEKPFELKKLDPVVSLIVCLFLIFTDIKVTRIILIGDFSTGLFKFVKSLIKTPVVAVVFLAVYVILVAIRIYVVLKNMSYSSEVFARYCLDSMNGKFFDIDYQFINKKITMQECEFHKKKVRDVLDFYSCLIGNAKFIKGTTYCVVLLSVVQLFGGILIAYEKYHMDLEIAITIYCSIISLVGVVFLNFLLIICVAFGVFSLRGKIINLKFDTQLLSDFEYAKFSYLFTVSLGKDLIPMVENHNNGQILKDLMKELSDEINFYSINFRKGYKLHPTEYVVSWNGKTKRGILDLREGEDLCATEIVEAVRNHWNRLYSFCST